MPINNILPFFSSVVMAVFTVFVFQRWWARRAPQFLFWGIGLAMFAVGSFAEAYLALWWHPVVFFAWYLFGAALNAAWIGHGTLYLLVRKKWVHGVTVVLILGSLVATVLMLQVMPLLDVSHYSTTTPISEVYRAMMPEILQGAQVRLTTPFFNSYGVITLVGGALWSAYLFWRKRVLPNRVIANVLIASGALLVAGAGLLTRFGLGGWLYIGELLAAILMFAGFLVAAQPQPSEKPVRNTAGAVAGD